MSLVCSWNEVGMSYVQASSSPFLHAPLLANAGGNSGKNTGKIPETLSELFLAFPSRVWKPPEQFPEFSPPPPVRRDGYGFLNGTDQDRRKESFRKGSFLSAPRHRIRNR